MKNLTSSDHFVQSVTELPWGTGTAKITTRMPRLINAEQITEERVRNALTVTNLQRLAVGEMIRQARRGHTVVQQTPDQTDIRMAMLRFGITSACVGSNCLLTATERAHLVNLYGIWPELHKDERPALINGAHFGGTPDKAHIQMMENIKGGPRWAVAPELGAADGYAQWMESEIITWPYPGSALNDANRGYQMANGRLMAFIARTLITNYAHEKGITGYREYLELEKKLSK